jgi:signal transduction histidine kinase
VIEEAANGEFVRYETEVMGDEGLATIDFSVKPVTDETGEVTSIIVEGRDITAQRQRRQHLDVLQRVMRHNMRNDLTKVRNWAQVMSTEPDSHARAAHFDRIVSVLDKWDDMSTKLKQIQHAIQSEKIHWADVDPASLVSEIVSERNNAHPDATIETTTAAVESQQTPSLLRSVLTQLIDNSVEATEQGAAYVEVSLSQPDTVWLEFTVRDSGPGMPHAEAEMLETGEETQLTHGSSLGLWMVRMFVKQVGGDVSVDVSEAGTVVTLRIPAHQHREPQPRAL